MYYLLIVQTSFQQHYIRGLYTYAELLNFKTSLGNTDT